MSNTTNQTAIERAEALLTGWEQRLSQSNKQTPPATAEGTTEAGGAVQRAEALLAGKGPKSSGPKSGPESSGRGLVGAAARVYVALATKTGEIVEPVVKNWQESVDEARREQEREAAQSQGGPGAKQEGSDEKEGEKALKGTAGAAAEAAGTAAGA